MPSNEPAKPAIHALKGRAGKSRAAPHAFPRKRKTSGASHDASGLVHSQTSDTQEGQCHGGYLLDPRVFRQSRMRKSLITGARLIDQERRKGGRRGRWAMISPTYRPGCVYEPGDISALLKCIRQWLKRRGIGLYAVWKAELGEKNGRFHYHVLVWLPLGMTMPKPDKQGWWKKGMTKIEWARNAVGYVAKYASKLEEGDLPKGARMYGVLGLEGEGLLEYRWWKCPKWVREAMPEFDHQPTRRKGGGWYSRTTGEVIRGHLQFGGFVWVNGRRCVRLVEAERREPEDRGVWEAIKKAEEIAFHEAFHEDQIRQQKEFQPSEWPEWDREETPYVFEEKRRGYGGGAPHADTECPF